KAWSEHFPLGLVQFPGEALGHIRLAPADLAAGLALLAQFPFTTCFCHVSGSLAIADGGCDFLSGPNCVQASVRQGRVTLDNLRTRLPFFLHSRENGLGDVVSAAVC